jgi:hypothetical protein
MTSWWMFASGHFARIVRTVKWAFDIDSLAFGEESIAVPAQIQEYLGSVPIYQHSLLHSAMLMSFGLAIFGSLFMISKNQIEYKKLSFVAGGLLIMLVGFIPLGSVIGIIHRWWFFGQILLAIPLAIAIVKISAIRLNKLYQFLLL